MDLNIKNVFDISQLLCYTNKVLEGRKFLKIKYIFLDSSAAEHSAVNRRVVGSNPTRGVKATLSC